MRVRGHAEAGDLAQDRRAARAGAFERLKDQHRRAFSQD